MGVTREAVVGTAAGWVGLLEETGNNDIWFSRDWGISGQSWCFAFTQSGFYYAPQSPTGKLPHESMYCPYGIAWARQNGQAIEVGEAGPQAGDIVFFSWDMVTWPRWRAGTGDHVGIVEAWDGGDLIWTIEGNIGNPQGVYRKVRSIGETVVCFWRPTVYGDTPHKEEEDLTPEQAQTLTDIKALLDEVKPRWDQTFRWAGHTYGTVEPLKGDLDKICRQTLNGVTNLPETLRGMFGDGGASTGPAGPVLDVEASLRQATPDQLAAALTPDQLLAALSRLWSSKTPPAV